MGHNASLPVHVQKAVLGRMLVYKALDLHRADIEAADYGTFWKQLRDRLHASTDLQLQFRDDSRPVSDYLRALAQELRSALSFPNSASEQVCAPLLDDIDKLMDEASTCTEDLLVEAFRQAVAQASAEYRDCELALSDGIVDNVSITFDHQSRIPDNLLPVNLRAVTFLDATSTLPSARVEIVLAPGDLDELTAFALPYVLLHECLCHVFQGPWTSLREQADANSRFAEGWMDVVAFRLHAELSLKDGSFVSLMTPLRLAAQLDAAEQVHAARRAPQRSDRAWAHRAIGYDAAILMADRLTRLAGTQDAQTAFMHLSLSLNASSVANNDRDRFVTFIHEDLDKRMSEPQIVLDLLRDYLRDHDAMRLVSRVLDEKIRLTND